MPTIDLDNLRSSLTGRVVTPTDDDYDEARALFYTGVTGRPLALVRPAHAADVATAVVTAARTSTPVAVRGGGHSINGFSGPDGALVIDLTDLRQVEVDPTGRQAWAGGGLTAIDYLNEVGEYGLTTGFGDTATVGIAGITLGGGVGFLHRRHGLTCDNLLAAEIVTADGQVRHLDRDTEPDLFWAIRGGGGNFGVVTRLQYRLHEVGQVVAGLLAFAAEPETIAGVLTTLTASSSHLGGMVNVVAAAPPMPMIPAELHGRPVALAILVHSGTPDEAQRELDALRQIAPPVMDQMETLPYHQVYDGPEPPQPPMVQSNSCFLDEVDTGTADRLLDALRQATSAMAIAQFRPMGGAVADVPADATAFAHRDRRLMAIVNAAYGDPAETATHAEWAERTAGIFDGATGAYVNFLSDPSAARRAYPQPTWDRLVAVKAAYDPENLFRYNVNVSG